MSTVSQSILESIYDRFFLLYALCSGHLALAFCIPVITKRPWASLISFCDFILPTPSITIQCSLILWFIF